MKEDKIKTLAKRLANMGKHPRISWINFKEKQSFTKDYIEGKVSNFTQKEIIIYAINFETSEEIQKFITWVRYCLNIDKLDKSVSDAARYTTMIDDFNLIISANVKKENQIDVLSELSGCRLVTKIQTFRTETLVCENKL